MGKKKYPFKSDAASLSSDIEKTFKKFGVNILISEWTYHKDRVRYEVQMKGRTRVDDIVAHASDVQIRLKLPIFQVTVENFTPYIVVSDHPVEYPHFLKTMDSTACEDMLQGQELPYLVGHDITGQPVVVDLAKLPHLLIGGSTFSGKTVGLQALIASCIYNVLPDHVNFILIDVGASDLMAFEGIPHLSCPVVKDHDTAYIAIIALKAEMERRIKLEYASPAEYKQLPRLVLVIDELPALLNGGLDKDRVKRLTNAISSLLQRGRHAKIHLVLSAQNPTYQNVKIDLSNITARIAFKCAKQNFSETILDEGGAENLSEKGSLLLKSPQSDGIQWIQGIYIRPKDIQNIIRQFTSPLSEHDIKRKFNLTIATQSATDTKYDLQSYLHPIEPVVGPSNKDLLLATVIFWAFGRDYVSTNGVMVAHHLGWNKAANLIKKLEELGIADKMDGKKPRRVRPKTIDDLSDELLEFMVLCDYPRNSIADVFQEREEGNRHR